MLNRNHSPLTPGSSAISPRTNRSRTTRWVAASAATVLALGVGATAVTQSAEAAPQAAVKASTTHTVNARKAPFVNAQVVKSVPAGTTVSLACHTTGDTVFSEYSKQNTNLWNYSPDVDAFISDGYLNTGVNGPAKGLPECQNVPGKPADPKPSEPAPAPAKGKLIPVRQGQGQDDFQWFDCGPASLVMVANVMGKTPHSWDANNQVPAILKARQDMGYYPSATRHGTNSAQAIAGLQTYGLKGQRSTDVNTMLAHVRSGRPAILMGEAQTIPWPENIATKAPILHWIVIAGYDAKADEYLVLDPANRPEANQVHRAKASFLQRYNAQNPGEGGVMVS